MHGDCDEDRHPTGALANTVMAPPIPPLLKRQRHCCVSGEENNRSLLVIEEWIENKVLLEKKDGMR
jgi:hypothetical protein